MTTNPTEPPANLKEQIREDVDDLEGFENEIALQFVDAAVVLIDFAFQNIHRVVMDEHGNVVWKEAFMKIRALAAKRATEYRAVQLKKDGVVQLDPTTKQPILVNKPVVPRPTLEEYAVVMEEYARQGTFDFDRLDEVLNGLHPKLRIPVYIGLNAAKDMIANEKLVGYQLRDGGTPMILTMLQRDETKGAYRILKNKPYLLKSFRDYMLLKLGLVPDPLSPAERNEMKTLEADQQAEKKRREDAVGQSVIAPESPPSKTGPTPGTS